jgi:hypothetical protein
MGKFDKLLDEIKLSSKNLRFEQLAKALVRIGYTQSQPKSGSSHYKFSKKGKPALIIPKSSPVKEVYIEAVRKVVIEYELEIASR